MRKRLIILVGLFLFVIAGTASAGKSMQPLADWHNQQFKSISVEIGAVTAVGLLNLYKTTNQFVKETKFTLSRAFEQLTGSETKAVIEGISHYEEQLNKELTTTVNELNKQNFNNYKEQQSIDQTITDEVNELLEDILSE